MVTTPCRFGGVRWWWLCPATARKCTKLYLPNGGRLFLSRGRGAYSLGYASQRGTWIDRAHGRVRRLYRKLGADYSGLCATWPEKPKGMRWATYERIIAALEKTEAELGRGFIERARRLLGSSA